MSVVPVPARHRLPRRVPLFGVALGAVAVLAVLWLVALTRPSVDGGSLDSRAAAVGATVRCPICHQPIPLNDVTGWQADQMRGLIRAKLQQGESEDGVRQDLAGLYGRDILLAPPQQGFDALAWFVPLLVVAACAVALLLSIRRWSDPSRARASEVLGLGPGLGGPWQGTDPEGSSNGGAGRYEELLDRELRRRG